MSYRLFPLYTSLIPVMARVASSPGHSKFFVNAHWKTGGPACMVREMRPAVPPPHPPHDTTSAYYICMSTHHFDQFRILCRSCILSKLKCGNHNMQTSCTPTYLWWTNVQTNTTTHMTGKVHDSSSNSLQWSKGSYAMILMQCMCISVSECAWVWGIYYVQRFHTSSANLTSPLGFFHEWVLHFWVVDGT